MDKNLPDFQKAGLNNYLSKSVHIKSLENIFNRLVPKK